MLIDITFSVPGNIRPKRWAHSTSARANSRHLTVARIDNPLRRAFVDERDGAFAFWNASLSIDFDFWLPVHLVDFDFAFRRKHVVYEGFIRTETQIFVGADNRESQNKKRTEAANPRRRSSY